MNIQGTVTVSKCLSVASKGASPVTFCTLTGIRHNNDGKNLIAVCRILRGNGSVELSGNVYPVSDGDLFLINSKEKYIFSSADAIRVSLVVFNPYLFGSAYAHEFGHAAIASINSMISGRRIITRFDPDFAKITEALDELWLLGEISEGALYGDASPALIAISLMWRLAALLCREMNRRGANYSKKQERNQNRLAPAIHYICKNYDQKLTLADLARQVNMSIPNFSTIFRQTFGVSPIEYLGRFRMQVAAELLLNTDKKIIDVASESGFFSNSNFIKVFHKSMGMSPSQYRNSANPTAIAFAKNRKQVRGVFL